MNMQAIMRQAQNLQKEMLKTKDEIDAKTFEYNNSVISIKANGKKEILNINIKFSEFDNEDLLEINDIVMVGLNSLFKDIDNYTESKMSKFSNIPGLF